MKLTSYNLQNIFYRHIDLVKSYRINHLSDWKEEFESIQLKNPKNQNEINRLRELAILIGFHDDDDFENVHLETIEGALFYSPLINTQNSNGKVVKNWTGWAKSKSISIAVKAIANKAKAILESDADILVVQEVESRLALLHFNKVYLKEAYVGVFFMEGNSTKSRGLGILLKKGYDLSTMNSFANEKNLSGNILFENDVQLYMVKTPNNDSVFIINALLGNESDKTRIDGQFDRIAALVKMCSLASHHYILTGTLGLPSYNKKIRDLIDKSSLKQINAHSNFEVTLDKGSDSSYYRLGAYAKGVNIKQQDYLMVSSKLFAKISECGLNRKGVWPRKNPSWDTYRSLDGERDMASEHPLLWAEFTL